MCPVSFMNAWVVVFFCSVRSYGHFVIRVHCDAQWSPGQCSQTFIFTRLPGGILRVQIRKPVPACLFKHNWGGGVEMVIAKTGLAFILISQNDSFVVACLPIVYHCKA